MPNRAVRIVLAASVIGLLLLIPVLGPTPPSRADAAADGGYTVSVTPQAGVIDGQRVSIIVKTTSEKPTYPVYQAEAKLCRSGVTYGPSEDPHVRPNEDFLTGGANCPNIPISTSADVASVDTGLFDQVQTERGNLMTLRVGTGVANWTNIRTNGPETLTCDTDHPCSLVVEVLAGTPATWEAHVFEITYRIEDPVAGCGGPAKGVLATGGSDRMSDAWVQWTLAECRLPNRVGAAGRASFQGEGPALSSYTSGGLDLVYTARGYDPEAELAPASEGSRSSVPVPVGVNATVLALGGGSIDSDFQKVPYQDIKMTAQEVAALLGGGYQGLLPHLNDIQARNPEFQFGVFDPNSLLPYAYADAESTSYNGTNFLHAIAPADFRVPDTPGFGSDAGRPRGADSNLALADPSYAQAVSLVTGRPTLIRAINGASPLVNGAVFVLTDLDTARALGLTPVQIGNADGQFVAPTPESMAAAVAQMTPDSNGLLALDPTVTAASATRSVAGVEPYPLTQVEYALAPTAPLADADNVCRPDSQALLAGWLTYVTTDGQKALPAGMEPLPPALQAQAETAIAKVGATPSATPCTDSAGNPPPTSPPSSPSNNGYGGSSFGSNGSAGRPLHGSRGDTPAAAAPDGAAAAELAAAGSDIPGYGGGRLASGLIATIAIVGMVVLVTAAARLTSRSGAGTSPDGPP